MPLFKRHINLTNKLFLFFLSLSMGAVLTSSILSYFNTRNVLLDNTYKQLTSVRVLEKKYIDDLGIKNSNYSKNLLMELQKKCVSTTRATSA